jgi:hypothetical protein
MSEGETKSQSLFDQRSSNWIDQIEALQADEIEGGGAALDSDEISGWVAATLQGWVDQRVLEVEIRMRRQIGDLRRVSEADHAERVSERRRRVVESAGLRHRISELEAAAEKRDERFEALAKQLASLERSVARDRSLRRLVDARRLLPHQSQNRKPAAAKARLSPRRLTAVECPRAPRLGHAR